MGNSWCFKKLWKYNIVLIILSYICLKEYVYSMVFVMVVNVLVF